jgi:hypothetical protein
MRLLAEPTMRALYNEDSKIIADKSSRKGLLLENLDDLILIGFIQHTPPALSKAVASIVIADFRQIK